MNRSRPPAVYGALPEARLSAELLHLVRTGKVYALSHPIEAGAPHAATTSAFSMRPKRRHADPMPDGPFGEATETLTMSSHTATHLDALCHISDKSRGAPLLFGSIPAAQLEGEGGFAELGVERCPPFLGRGLLLDIPRSKGLSVLPDSYGIGEADLLAACRLAGVDIRAGDALLIRTGFSRYRRADPPRFGSVGAGPTPAGCRWLAEQGVVLTGSDTMSYEQVRSPHLGHVELICRRGIPILKQLDLEGLAADQVWEFLLIVLPLRLVGATASPVAPVAVC